MDVRSLGLRTDLMIRRIGGSAIEDHPDHIVVRTPANPTFRWGNFLIQPAPLRRGQAASWTALWTAHFPDAAHRAFAVDTVDGTAGDPEELQRLGVTTEVSTVLTGAPARIAAAAAAAGAGAGADQVTCRPLSSDEDWSQALQLRLACDADQDSPAHRLFAERKLVEARAMTATGCGTWLGAIVDGAVVARLGIFSDGSGLARYQDVETHPDYRRRGLARALLARAADYAAKALGAHTVVIVADPAYHAIELYRAIGFTATEQTVQLEAVPDE